MTAVETFYIAGKEFFAAKELFAENVFTVKSALKNYSVSWQDDINPFHAINQLLNQNKKHLLLVDKNVFELYCAELSSVDSTRIFVFDANETSKTLNSVMQVIDFLADHQFTKAEQLIVVGGGVVQEVGAFAGAIYKRGISWLHFPTTLVSMCDSCIGGKAGINYRQAKNQLGLFSTPTQIIINPHFLSTLDASAVTSGLGEILKVCILGGEYFLKIYQECVQVGKIKNSDNWKKLISAALAVKKAVVEGDEFESNERRSLNYGHTFGHAIEALSDYRIPHGQAVVIGMVISNELSHAHSLLNAENLQRLNQLCFDLLDKQVLEILQQIDIPQLTHFLREDKKTIGHETCFVFMAAAGDVRLVNLCVDDKFLIDVEGIISKFPCSME